MKRKKKEIHLFYDVVVCAPRSCSYSFLSLTRRALARGLSFSFFDDVYSLYVLFTFGLNFPFSTSFVCLFACCYISNMFRFPFCTFLFLKIIFLYSSRFAIPTTTAAAAPAASAPPDAASFSSTKEGHKNKKKDAVKALLSAV